MTLDQLFTLFKQAQTLCGHTDYVVIGSLSVLGASEDNVIPGEMSMSIDIDCYTKTDPARIFDLQALLGEDSAFHVRHGYHLDAVSPHLPSLPDGWEGRLNRVQRDGLSLWFLEPNDAAISKYARGEPRDVRWIRAGILSGLVSLPTVRSRLRHTLFLDEDETHRARSLVAADSAWFDTVKSTFKPG